MKIGRGVSELWGIEIAIFHWRGTSIIQPYKPWLPAICATNYGPPMRNAYGAFSNTVTAIGNVITFRNS